LRDGIGTGRSGGAGEERRGRGLGKRGEGELLLMATDFAVSTDWETVKCSIVFDTG
jgi:hypothetical protein